MTPLTRREIKVLKALKEAGVAGLTRKQLIDQIQVSNGWAKMLGAEKPDNLTGRGFVKSRRVLVSMITPAGRKALSQSE